LLRGNVDGRKWKHLVELGVNEFDRYLHSGQTVVTSEINGALGMLKIVSLDWVGGPIAEAAYVKLRPYVLEQDLHCFSPIYSFFSGFKVKQQPLHSG